MSDTLQTQLSFQVDDMSCEHCKDCIDKDVRALNGVDNVDINLDTKLVTIHGKELAEQVISEAIMMAGYTPRLVG